MEKVAGTENRGPAHLVFPMELRHLTTRDAMGAAPKKSWIIMCDNLCGEPTCLNGTTLPHQIEWILLVWYMNVAFLLVENQWI